MDLRRNCHAHHSHRTRNPVGFGCGHFDHSRGAAIQTARAQEKLPSLYERLGGAYSIATVVDDFIERLLVNPTLNANPAISDARARVPKAGLKFHVTTQLCEVTGGPCKYTGRPMKEAHQHLNITQAQWDAMADDFQRTLEISRIRVGESSVRR